MGFLKFYGHFAAAYGTLWLVMLILAFVSQSHIDTGLFGLVGFPIIALIYATVRMVSSEAVASAFSLDPPPSGFTVPKGAVPCDAFECGKCNHISRVVNPDQTCIHCGALRPANVPT
jgi:hypothetical protein